MNRRSFLKGLVGGAAALVAAPELILPPEPEQRFWQLDRTMIGQDVTPDMLWPDYITRFVDAMERVETPFLDEMKLRELGLVSPGGRLLI